MEKGNSNPVPHHVVRTQHNRKHVDQAGDLIRRVSAVYIAHPQKLQVYSEHALCARHQNNCPLLPLQQLSGQVLSSPFYSCGYWEVKHQSHTTISSKPRLNSVSCSLTSYAFPIAVPATPLSPGFYLTSFIKPPHPQISLVDKQFVLTAKAPPLYPSDPRALLNYKFLPPLTKKSTGGNESCAYIHSCAWWRVHCYSLYCNLSLPITEKD